VIVSTRSITVIKSLALHSGFLSWMAEPIVRARNGVPAFIDSPFDCGVDGGRGWWPSPTRATWPYRRFKLLTS